LALLGWMLFFFWWTRVAFESTAAAAIVAVAVLVVIAVSIFYSTLIWIRHNLGLARRGKRGFSTRYLRPLFERDWLDRAIVFHSSTVAREGTWFVVHMDEKEKRYSHRRLIAANALEPEKPGA
jgi:hypothetical protein